MAVELEAFMFPDTDQMVSLRDGRAIDLSPPDNPDEGLGFAPLGTSPLGGTGA